jgi:heme-degrading monooxygenase HmoA
MFIALSRFEIANGMSDQVRAAFQHRPHLVDGAPGFSGMDVMSPVDCPEEIWLLTRWDDEQSYRLWHHGHEYRDSHKGIPKGLKLVRGRTAIELFHVFAN